jgi:hypothetical protein
VLRREIIDGFAADHRCKRLVLRAFLTANSAFSHKYTIGGGPRIQRSAASTDPILEFMKSLLVLGAASLVTGIHFAVRYKWKTLEGKLGSVVPDSQPQRLAWIGYALEYKACWKGVKSLPKDVRAELNGYLSKVLTKPTACSRSWWRSLAVFVGFNALTNDCI